jgi:hypothetical protein
LSVELITRLTMTRVESLDLFVNTVQQKMQVASPQQSTIFEGRSVAAVATEAEPGPRLLGLH